MNDRASSRAAYQDRRDRAAAVPIESVIGDLDLKREGSEYVGPCPSCGGEDRFAVNVVKQVFRCRQCNEKGGNVITLVMWLDGCAFDEAVTKLTGEEPSAPTRLKVSAPLYYARRSFNEARTFGRTPHPYFLARGIDTTKFDALDGVLRITPSAQRKYVKNGPVQPAVIAALTDEKNAVQNVVRTFLTADESAKDGGDPSRKFVYGLKAKGLAIKIPCGTSNDWPSTTATSTILFAEGLEDVMTAMLVFGRDCAGWASSGWTNMRHLVPPPHTKQVVVLTDNDDVGGKGARLAAVALKGRGVESVAIAYPPEGAKDFNELIKGKTGAELEEGLEQVRTAIEAAMEYTGQPQAQPAPGKTGGEVIPWPQVDRHGNPRNESYPNTLVALTHLDLTFSYDTFRYRNMVQGDVLGRLKGHLQDAGARKVRRLVNDSFKFDPGKSATWEASLTLCDENPFHPVLIYLAGLKWDTTKPSLLDRWLFDCLKMEETPFLKAVGRIVPIAAVRRVRQPGVKFDHMMVIEGPQRAGKSKVLKLLGKGHISEGGFFSDAPILYASYERQIERMKSVWIYEIAELAGIKKTDVSQLKVLFSSGEDHARQAYDRAVSDFPRQCVLIGTTNDKNYLADPTGNTRYWPGLASVTGQIDVSWMETNVDQLWAEAAHYEAVGESIELDPSLYEDADKEQKKREQLEPWIDRLSDPPLSKQSFVHCKKTKGGQEVLRVHSIELMRIVLGVKTGDPTPNITPDHYRRLGQAMRAMGWDGPKQLWLNSINNWGYERFAHPSEKKENAPPSDKTEEESATDQASTSSLDNEPPF